MKLSIIPISSISIGIRARKDLGNIEDIQESSESFMGQIQTIAVCESLETNQYELLDGGRRLEAFKKSGKTEVAVRIYPKTLTLLEKKSIELIGNKARLDFKWDEEIALTKEIHELQTSIREEEKKSDPTLKSWTRKDTADSIGVSETTIERDIKLASIAEKVPQIKAAKNKKDAMLYQDKLIEKLMKEELAKRISAEIAKTGLEKIRKIIRESYKLGDFFIEADSLPNEHFDFAEVDPPYGINLDVKRNDRNSMAETASREDFNNWDKGDIETYSKKILETMTICFAKMRPGSFIIVWYDINATAEITLEAMNEAGFKVDRNPAIWLKNVQSRNFNPSFRLGRRYEPFYYGYKRGPGSLAKIGRDNVFDCTRVSNAERIHPTEKPRELLKEVIETFCQPGSKILSPFLGSGNTILSAYDAGCECVGFDLGKSYKDSFDIRVEGWRPPR